MFTAKSAASRFFIYEGDKGSIPQILDDFRFAVGKIAVRIESGAQDPFAAIQDAMPVFDRVLESLSFQMQTALPVHAVRAIDLTGAPVVGDERDGGMWSGLA